MCCMLDVFSPNIILFLYFFIQLAFNACNFNACIYDDRHCSKYAFQRPNIKPTACEELDQQIYCANYNDLAEDGAPSEKVQQDDKCPVGMDLFSKVLEAAAGLGTMTGFFYESSIM